MRTCPACKKQFDEKKINVAGFCSWACKSKGPAKAPTMVKIRCKWCEKEGVFESDTSQAKHIVCSKPCLDKYTEFGCNVGQQMVNFLFTKHTHQISQFLTDEDLAKVSQVSRTLNKPAMLGQLGPAYHHEATHFDGRRGAVKIPADKMLEIALQSYRTALRLKAAKLPVILYRVKDKKFLSKDEESNQTVAGAVKTADNLWPVERTAAWIQGAMRARVPFLVLTDPRGKGALLGGKDKKSDAVYVRELYQISQTHYTIGTTVEDELPSAMKGQSKTIFKMVPPSSELGPMPLIPKMSNHMDYSHTWDSSKSSLTVNAEDVDTMAAYVVKIFKEADQKLSLAEY